MVVEFLNEKFSSLSALNSVDQVVTDIESARATIHESSNDDASSSSKEVDSLLQSLEKLLKSDDVSVSSIDGLIDKYGNIEILSSIKHQLIKREQLIEQKYLQGLFAQVYESIEAFEVEATTEDDMKVIMNSLKSLNGEITDFKSQTYNVQKIEERDMYVEQLDKKLSSTIVDNIKDRSMGSLRDLLKVPFNEITELSPVIAGFKELLELQSFDPINKSQKYPIALWAFQVLSEDFHLKFVYHFQTSNELNRLDKPELAFHYLDSYLVKNLDQYQSTLAVCLSQSIYSDEVFQFHFITALLMSLRDKVSKDLVLIEGNERQLSHLVYELQKFDQLLIKKYKYNPFFVGGGYSHLAQPEWLGLMNDLILSKESLFLKWLSTEKEFVSHRYDELVNSEDSFMIDYDFAEMGKTKPTKSAINLKSLLENITSNYEHLPLKYKLKFLSEVQLKLLDFYYEKLKNGLVALETHYLKSRNAAATSVSTVERLCRIWCSVEFTIETMQNWGEQLVFIELWNSINTDNSSDQINVKSSFFDSVIGHYKKLLEKVVIDLDGFLERKLNSTMKNYFAIRTWAEHDESIVKPNEMSPELNPVIQAISQDISLVQKAISTTSFLSLRHGVSSFVASYFERNIIKSQRFSILGATKLSTDIQEVWRLLSLPKDDNMRRLLQQCLILSGTTKFRDLRSCQNHYGDEISLLGDSSIEDVMLRKV